MTADLFLALGSRLMMGGEQLLAGNEEVVGHFAAVLNAAMPDDERVAPTLRALFRLVPTYSFAPGSRLLNDGTEMRRLPGGSDD